MMFFCYTSTLRDEIGIEGGLPMRVRADNEIAPRIPSAMDDAAREAVRRSSSERITSRTPPWPNGTRVQNGNITRRGFMRHDSGSNAVNFIFPKPAKPEPNRVGCARDRQTRV